MSLLDSRTVHMLMRTVVDSVVCKLGSSAEARRPRAASLPAHAAFEMRRFSPSAWLTQSSHRSGRLTVPQIRQPWHSPTAPPSMFNQLGFVCPCPVPA